MSLNASDRQFLTAASGTTVTALFYQTANSTLPFPAIAYSTDPTASNLKMVPSPEEFEEREWDRLLATPESDAFLDMLEEEALRDYREGRTKEGGFGRD